MFKKIKSLAKKIISLYYLKSVNGLAGKIEIKDDKIIFYINKNKLEKNKAQKSEYNYTFNDASILKYNKCVLTKYNLNKPFYYVIENIDFKDKVYFNISSNSHLIFRNCTFNNQIEIYGKGNVVFENNNYFSKKDSELTNKSLIKIDVNNVKFYNEVLNNTTNAKKFFNIDIESDSVEIINSTIETDGKIKIVAKEIDVLSSKISSSDIFINVQILDAYKSVLGMENNILEINTGEMILDLSCIYADLISLKVKKIECNKTRIISKNGIILENDNNKLMEYIYAPLIIYNGILKSSNEEIVKITELSSKRKQLLQLLKTIKNMQENINFEETGKVLKLRSNYDR